MFKYERLMVAQFRAGVLPLRIETDRYSNIKDTVKNRFRKLLVCERLCQVCHLNETANEEHFLSSCPCYTDTRSQLYHSYSMICPNFQSLSDNDKFILILSNPVIM